MRVSFAVMIGIISWFTSPSALFAQRVHTLYADSLQRRMELSFVYGDWYFHPGDSRQPVTGTQGWDTLRSPAFGRQNPPPGWTGIGWFGLWVRADAKAVNRELALRINHDGASEIFLDGKPIGGFGKVGLRAGEMRAIRMPYALVPFWLTDTAPHLIGIRYSNFFGVYPNFLGFEPFVGDYAQMQSKFQDHRYGLLIFLPMCAAAMFIIAVLHFFLFFFYPSKKPNLYFAVFTILLGMVPLSSYVFLETPSPTTQYRIEFVSNECKVLLMWVGAALLYSIGYGHFAKWKKWVLGIVCSLYMLRYLVRFFWYEAGNFIDHFEWPFAVFFCDAGWNIIRAMSRKQRSVWLIAGGMLVVLSVCLFNWLDLFHFWTARQNALRLFTLSVGELVFPVCVSIYLALDFAQAMKRIETEAKRLDAMVQERTAEIRQQAEQLKEADAVKSRLFTNITHEFKTPLTLIDNPAQHLLEKSRDAFVLYNAGLIKKNANRLSQLINQLLDLNRLDSGLMDVVNGPVEVVALMRELLQSYEPMARKKGLKIDFRAEADPLWVLTDGDKLTAIAGNILFNAIKFTRQGRIGVNLMATGGSFAIVIRDTGIGIPAAKLPYIFDRFYQVELSDSRSAEGSGIGLAVAKEFVQLLKGKIAVSSEEGVYTEFMVELPMIAAPPQAADRTPTEFMMPPAATGTEILIIEDNEELREFVARSLDGTYKVLQAADGTSGVQLALENIPDLIITDIMMPGMGGYEVCARLKADSKTSHIPMIMLTAKVDVDSRVQGIEVGADAYLGKPFAQKELLALMENLLRTRRALQEKYSQGSLGPRIPEEMPSIDKQFLDRVRQAIHEHLDDALFGADQLAVQLGFSRTQLHRKLKGLIDTSPGELIRTIRLEYAHSLLKQRAATVSEVAYRVGFAEPASFSRSFSRHFGFPPSAAGGRE